MATLASDTFTGSNGSAWGSTWTTGLTPTGGGTTIQGNAGQLATGTTGGYSGSSRIARRANITAPADVVHSLRFQFVAGQEVFPALVVRSNGSNANLLDTQQGYYLSMSTSGWSLDRKGTPGAAYSNTVVTSGSWSLSTGTWYRVIYGAVGTALKMVWWPESGSMPTTWTMEQTDSSNTSAGAAGITIGGGAAAASQTFLVDDWTITDTFPLLTTPTVAGDFPNDPLPVVIQAKFDGVNWTDITDDVLVRDAISVTRGKQDEQSAVEPAKVALTLRNPDGRYSPRNPEGPYYGQIGRNTQLRVGVISPTSWMHMWAPTQTGTAFNQRATTPDSAALSITGDLDVRFDADFDTWAESLELLGKWGASGQRSWQLVLREGELRLYTSADGTTVLTHTCPYPLPRSTGRMAVRATIDVNNGASGRTVTWYTAPTLDGSWVQLGAPVVASGTTSIFDSTAPVTVGENADFTQLIAATTYGRILGAEVRQGIAGTVRASPDFTAQTAGATSFADAQGNTWTMNVATIETLDVRGHGEVPYWPAKWDPSGRDVWTPITAEGPMRRLTAGGTTPLRSAMYRATIGDLLYGTVRAYWPLEDVDGAEGGASALSDGRPLRVPDGDNATWANYEGFRGSAPLPTLGAASTSWSGAVRRYTSTGQIVLSWLMRVPAGGLPFAMPIIQLNVSGTAGTWWVKYGSGGDLSIVAFPPGTVNDFGAVAFGVNGVRARCELRLQQDGSDVDFTLTVQKVGGGGGSTSGTLTGRTLGRATGVVVGSQGWMEGLVIGHIAVADDVNAFSFMEVAGDAGPVNGWRTEAAGRRIQRLCTEEAVPFRWFGDLDDTVEAGYQQQADLLTLLSDAAAADGGVLTEARDNMSILYVPRAGMQLREPTLTLPYGSNWNLEPVEDDEHTANDVTMTRAGGSSRRAVLEDGPMSTLPPPEGIGTYAVEETINVAWDRQLKFHAGRRLAIGTLDEARFPKHELMLEHPDIAGDADTTAAARALDVGHRLIVEGPMPDWLSREPIDQVVFGMVETLGVFEHGLVLNTVPSAPYMVGRYDSDATVRVARYDSGGTTLAVGSYNSTTTGFYIDTPEGPLWTTDPADFPFDWLVGGERVTVTAIAAFAGTVQVATVVRSVNGVVKSQALGTSVALADPVVYGL